MYKVKNIISSRLVKDAITRQVLVFDSKEKAEKCATSLNVFAAVDRRRAKFTVIPA